MKNSKRFATSLLLLISIYPLSFLHVRMLVDLNHANAIYEYNQVLLKIPITAQLIRNKERVSFAKNSSKSPYASNYTSPITLIDFPEV